MLFLLWISALEGNRITTLTITHNTTKIFLKNIGGPEKGRWFVDDEVKTPLRERFISENLIGYWFIMCITIYGCNFKLRQLWWIAQSWKKDVRGRWGQYMFHQTNWKFSMVRVFVNYIQTVIYTHLFWLVSPAK
jgi:hypothetical protein